MVKVCESTQFVEIHYFRNYLIAYRVYFEYNKMKASKISTNIKNIIYFLRNKRYYFFLTTNGPLMLLSPSMAIPKKLPLTVPDSMERPKKDTL